MRIEGDVLGNLWHRCEQSAQRQSGSGSRGEGRLRDHLKCAMAVGYDSCLENVFAVEFGFQSMSIELP
jgi:hypothetical protein